MSPEEQFYDEEVAPALAALMKRCQVRGMGFLAMVNYDRDGSIGRSVALPDGAPFMLRLANALAKSWVAGGGVNIDAFMMALERHARAEGHSSMYLKLLGIPLKPEDSAASSAEGGRS